MNPSAPSSGRQHPYATADHPNSDSSDSPTDYYDNRNYLRSRAEPPNQPQSSSMNLAPPAGVHHDQYASTDQLTRDSSESSTDYYDTRQYPSDFTYPGPQHGRPVDEPSAFNRIEREQPQYDSFYPPAPNSYSSEQTLEVSGKGPRKLTKPRREKKRGCGGPLCPIHTSFGTITWKTFLKRSYIKWYIILIVIGILVGLLSIYNDAIVKALEPKAEWLRDQPGGWVFVIFILIVISFPPLQGQEIVIILCGIIYGLWIGFAVAASGVLLGEIANFLVFRATLKGKGCFRAYFAKRNAELQEDLLFGCVSRLTTTGSFLRRFWLVWLVRMSVIPGPITTAIFATTGMSLLSFTAGTILTLPKQLAIVYIGVVFDEVPKSTRTKIISYSVLALTVVLTAVSAWYLYNETKKFVPETLEQIIPAHRRRLAIVRHKLDQDPTSKRTDKRKATEAGLVRRIRQLEELQEQWNVKLGKSMEIRAQTDPEIGKPANNWETFRTSESELR